MVGHVEIFVLEIVADAHLLKHLVVHSGQMRDFVQIDAHPFRVVHLLDRLEHANHRTKRKLILLLCLPSTLPILAPDHLVLHAVHHDMVHLELQDCHPVHQLHLLDEELARLPLLLLILRILPLLEDKSVEVSPCRVLSLHLFRHHDLHLLTNLLLILLVVVLAVELLDVWKLVIFRDGANHFVRHIEKPVDLSDPEPLLVEELELHPVEAEVVEYVPVGEYLRASCLLLGLLAVAIAFILDVLGATDCILVLRTEVELAELLLEELVKEACVQLIGHYADVISQSTLGRFRLSCFTVLFGVILLAAIVTEEHMLVIVPGIVRELVQNLGRFRHLLLKSL